MPDNMDLDTTAADAFLTRLGEHSVRYLFGNAGTDFPSVIEAYCKASEEGRSLPIPVVVPHENLAIAMAHGYYQATGEPPAIMLHVSVGTANAICGLMNASRDNIPILLFAGRTPITEYESFGTRNVLIHWAQEMFDQASMVREFVKWDYELRTADQAVDVVDRAVAIAMSEPRGPVYITLPREVLAQPSNRVPAIVGAVSRPAPPAPNAAALEQLAEWIIAAEQPLIISGGYGARAGDAKALAALAENHAIPIIAYRPRYSPVPSDHPMLVGYEVTAHIKTADLIIIVDTDVPWVPKIHQPNPDARIVHIGADPLYSNYVMRNFPSHLGITGQAATIITALTQTLDRKDRSRHEQSRRSRAADDRAALKSSAKKEIKTAARKSLSTIPWIAACVNEVKKPDDILVTELTFPLQIVDLPEPGCYFGLTSAGGLGWGLGDSIGHKLAHPNRRVIAIVGDGSYMFGNPTPAHFVCEALGLPVLTIIVNNAMWGAVRRATLAMYPNGAASKSNDPPLTYLKPSPRFEQVVEASGGYSERVEISADLPAALQRALHAIDVERRQAVLNVICEFADSSAAQDARKR